MLERDDDGDAVVDPDGDLRRHRAPRSTSASCSRPSSAPRSPRPAPRLLARTLQQTLIPPALPHDPGLDVAAVYRPAGDGDEIGGDFYDVFQIGVDDWVVAVGDVQGKGVDAAVVTALARYTIRAAAVEHVSRPTCSTS